MCGSCETCDVGWRGTGLGLLTGLTLGREEGPVGGNGGRQLLHHLLYLYVDAESRRLGEDEQVRYLAWRCWRRSALWGGMQL